MVQQLIYNPRPMGKSYHLQLLIYNKFIMQNELIKKIVRLGEDNELQAIADSLNQIEITNCYTIYEQENWHEPDSILDALDFITNNF